MEYEFFVTNRCNAKCSYCFVDKGEYRMNQDDAMYGVKLVCETSNKNDPVTIWGGEPTYAPNVVNKIVSGLVDGGMKNIYLYSNGNDIEFLEWMKLKGVHVVINMDAFINTVGYIDDKIRQFDWNLTIAPSNLDDILYWYYQFILAGKYHDFKLARYWRNGSQYWTQENKEKLRICLNSLYSEYVYILKTDGKSFMPYILKDSIKRLIFLNMGMRMNDCSEKREIRSGKIESCYFYDKKKHIYDSSCLSCTLKNICMFSKPCYERIPNKGTLLCDIFSILCEEAQNVQNQLSDNPVWERQILSIYEGA